MIKITSIKLASLFIIVISMSFCKKEDGANPYCNIGDPNGARCLLSKRSFSTDVYCDIIYDYNNRVKKLQWYNGSHTDINYNEKNEILNYKEYRVFEWFTNIYRTTFEWQGKSVLILRSVMLEDGSYFTIKKAIMEFDKLGQPIKLTIYNDNYDSDFETPRYYYSYKWRNGNLLEMKCHDLANDWVLSRDMVVEYEYDDMVNPKRFMSSVVFLDKMYYASRNNVVSKRSWWLGASSYTIVDYSYEYNIEKYPVSAELTETIVELGAYTPTYFYNNYNKVNWEYNCN